MFDHLCGHMVEAFREELNNRIGTAFGNVSCEGHSRIVLSSLDWSGGLKMSNPGWWLLNRTMLSSFHLSVCPVLVLVRPVLVLVRPMIVMVRPELMPVLL